MTLHFAYGSNMSRAVMCRHAPQARPVGAATLDDHRFVITADGYASVAPKRGATVHGVLWRLTPRDRVTLGVWENIAAGLYRAETLPVRAAGVGPQALVQALVYVARKKNLQSGGEGQEKCRAKPGYVDLVIAAAREWNFPASYIGSLKDWLPVRPLGSGARKLGEFG